MTRRMCSLILLSLLSSVSFGQVILSKSKVNVTNDIKKWSTTIKLKAQHDLISYKNDQDGYTECKRTSVASNVILCGSYLQRDMNALLLRATIFSEGLGNLKAGDIIPNNHKILAAHSDIIGGHDIKSTQLNAFYDKVNAKCVKEKKYCLTKNEKVFYDRVIKPIAKEDKSFVIITFSVQSSMPPQQIVSHEFLHAMYFLDDKYRTHINKFWQTQMKNNERNNVKKELKALGYSDRDDKLIQNEFQAYVLMDGAEDSRLAKLANKFEPKLFKYLKASM